MIFTLFMLFISQNLHGVSNIRDDEYKEKCIDMIKHVFDAYMKNAFPHDELMPLSCKGRIRGVTPDRGNIDDSLGNFSLTLIDSLDTLFLLNDHVLMEKVIIFVVYNVTFDSNLFVSVFETNIRILGGLIGAHYVLKNIKQKSNNTLYGWYSDHLVKKAIQIADILLFAFNTPTNLPYSRINLRTQQPDFSMTKNNLASCSTYLLEFYTLSQLSNNETYWIVALKAINSLWNLRNHENNLLPTEFHILTGEWVTNDISLGASADSFFEYLLKIYYVTGNHVFLHIFQKIYLTLCQSPFNYFYLQPIISVNNTNQIKRAFFDSLQAFWPGLLVSYGDILKAIEQHYFLYQVFTNHSSIIPEAFGMDLSIVWNYYNLRPEFMESTYLLYEATKHPFYLKVAQEIIDGTLNFCKVDCGFASLRNISDKSQSDDLHSFVISELFKYSYLIFDSVKNIESIDKLNLNNFVFSTEAHYMPLNYSHFDSNNKYINSMKSTLDYDWTHFFCYFNNPNKELLLSLIGYNQINFNDSNSYIHWCSKCPTTNMTYLVDYVHQNFVFYDNILSNHFMSKNHHLINVTNLDLFDKNHLELLHEMGISVKFDGRIHIVQYNSLMAYSDYYSRLGYKLFNDLQANATNSSKAKNQLFDYLPLFFSWKNSNETNSLRCELIKPATFNPHISLYHSNYFLKGQLIFADPIDACSPLRNSNMIAGNIALVIRGGCSFYQKSHFCQISGSKAVIIKDDILSSSQQFKESTFKYMSADDHLESLNITSGFISHEQVMDLWNHISSSFVNQTYTFPTFGFISNFNIISANNY